MYSVQLVREKKVSSIVFSLVIVVHPTLMCVSVDEVKVKLNGQGKERIQARPVKYRLQSQLQFRY